MSAFSLLFCVLLVVQFTSLGLERPSAPLASVVARGAILASGGEKLALNAPGGRRYPHGSLAGALVGFTGRDGGLEGAEFFFDDRLRRGENVRLTIDAGVQAVAESVLAEAVRSSGAAWGAVVVLETKTGRVLAAAGAPSLDPERWRASDALARRNHAFAAQFEPGSVVKPLVVAALMNEGRVTGETTFDTPMSRRVGRATINDAVAHPARLSVGGILRYSSNVGMTLLVDDVPPETLADSFARFGFGRAPDLGGVYASRGSLGAPQDWGVLGQATRAFGQGMTANTVQLAAAFNVLANDGVYVAPRLTADQPLRARRAIRAQVARSTRRLLHGVVDVGLPGRADLPGYHTAGKTGTAQVVVNGRYSDAVYTSTFTGTFPADAPRVTIAVAVQGAPRRYQGSQLAAPTFRDVVSGLASLWSVVPETSHDVRPKATVPEARP